MNNRSLSIKQFNTKYKIEFVSCHRKPERSFFYKGKQFPVCARCTGIYTGYLSAFLLFTDIIYINLLWSVLMILPTMFDGIVQAFTKWESTNLIRLITGIIAGIGIMSVANILGLFIAKLILIIFTNT